MNTILDLAKQAGLKFETELLVSPQEQKFAMLIIKETLKQTCESFDAQSEYDWRLKHMIEHFGIK